MADDQHILWLQDGVKSWNERRERTPFTPDLSGISFHEVFAETNQRDANGRVPLCGVNLAEADLSQAFIPRADFSDADFSNAQLMLADGKDSVFSNANFAGAELFAVMAESADFSKSNFLGATLGFARLNGTDLSDTNLTDVNLSDADLSGCDLSGATLTRTNLINAELGGAQLFGTCPWQATFYRPDATLIGQREAEQVKIERVSDLLDTITNLGANVPLYFRGEPALGLPLSPSLMREGLAHAEGDMLLDLISRRPQELSGMTTVLDQWVLARHHGLKTRFLDVTKNPLVGLFFACDWNEKYNHRDACLHVFSVPGPLGKTFNSDTISVISNFARLSKSDQDQILSPSESARTNGFRRDAFYSAWGRLYQLIEREKSNFERRVKVSDLYGVFVVQPQQSAERVRAQSGAFLVSAFRDHFDYPEGTDWNGGLRPYGHCTLTIPSQCKNSIRDELAMLNISKETLFPGLDSAAEAITALHSS